MTGAEFSQATLPWARHIEAIGTDGGTDGPDRKHAGPLPPRAARSYGARISPRDTTCLKPSMR